MIPYDPPEILGLGLALGRASAAQAKNKHLKKAQHTHTDCTPGVSKEVNCASQHFRASLRIVSC